TQEAEVPGDGRQLVPQVTAQVAGPVDELVVDRVAQDGQGGRSGQRVAAHRVPERELRDGHPRQYRRPYDAGTYRNVPCAQTFAGDDEVRRDAGARDAEPLAGPAESRHHLVNDHQGTGTVAEPAQTLLGLRVDLCRAARRSTDGLEADGRYLRGIEPFQDTQPVRERRKYLVVVRRLDVHDLGAAAEQRLQVVPAGRMGGDRERPGRHAVVAGPLRDDDAARTARVVVCCQAKFRLHRLRAGVGVDDLLEPGSRDREDQRAQLRQRPVPELAAVGEGHQPRLRRDRLEHLGDAVADVDTDGP